MNFLCRICRIEEAVGSTIEHHQILEFIGQIVHHEVHLVVLQIPAFLVSLENRHEYHIEVLLRMCSRLLIRIAEEDVSVPGNLMAAPIQFVLIDLEAGPIRIRGDTKNLDDEAEERFVLASHRHSLRKLGNQLVEVHTAFSTEVILAVLLVEIEILPRRGLDNQLRRGIHAIYKEFLAVSEFISYAEVFHEGFSTGAISLAKVTLQQLNGAGVHDSLSCRNLRLSRAGEIALNLVIDDAHSVRNRLEIRHCHKACIRHHLLPVLVVSNESGIIARNLLVGDQLELTGERLQHFTLSTAQFDALEIVEI